MSTLPDLDRRTFLTAVAVGGGLAVGVLGDALPARAGVPATSSALGAWVRIGADESVTILVGAAEMGQGVFTSLAQLVAEELEVDWARVRSEAAPAAAVYANPLTHAQLTGGSTSVRGYFDALRTAGAAAREMLVAAAAARFGVAPGACVAARGVVTCPSTGASARYGALAADAARRPVPTAPALKPPARWTTIGRSVPRVDLPAKVRGAAVYGIDVRVPGMLHAVVRHSPMVGGTVASVGPRPAGALGVVDCGDAVVVAAATTWEAMQAARGLKVTWTAPPTTSATTSATISAQARSLMTAGPAVVAESAGSATAAIAASTRTVDATYELPYLPHAPMEPPACTASVTAAGCELWAPTQAPGLAAATAAGICGLTPDKVTVHPTMLGGGLGRKFENDFVAHAVKASKALKAPVKVTWPREEDLGHDQYRPMALIRVRAGVTAGRLTGWSHRIVTPSILFQRGWVPDGAVDSQSVDGAVDLPYALPDRLVEQVRHPAAVPVGFWRSVGNSLNCFAVESALDEVALAAGVDPLALRLRLVDDPRAAAVLTAVTSAAGWSRPPAGRGLGLALTRSFGSYVALVAQVAQPAPGTVRVERVWCAADCGRLVNPDTVDAQLTGGILHGLSATLFGRTTFERGVASPRNFDELRVVRMADAPVVSVQLLPSTAAPGGVGEPGVPAVAPAVANAWARLTGVRRRSLPLG
ncbi:xanthine dehydrogenase family protein molybdopterin-binding subunit [Lapillicoccus jejuensis]|uniref:Isoquinoline 1-oxidoreductase beta subunit n=1 Tax=Lapillicoccus jejuensis TaxID=402171 RepID=A0A542E6W7_9MICO|nr:molybdopterin cofactor-binding domain-containing protein [Lapillicoccus jejuensis]TQJ11081.1 isoquinoline 1-oxidoreductase beta subunit [Lapillicoccus jejuensis]